MILHLQEEVVASEDIGVAEREALGVVVLIGEDGLRNVAAQAGGHGNEPLGVLVEQIHVDARLVIEAVEIGGRDQLNKVAIAVLVFAQQHQVVVAVGVGTGLVALPVTWPTGLSQEPINVGDGKTGLFAYGYGLSD